MDLFSYICVYISSICVAQVDLRSQAVWNGHPRHFVLDNCSDFDGKLEVPIADCPEMPHAKQQLAA